MNNKDDIKNNIKDIQKYLKELRAYQNDRFKTFSCVEIPYNQLKINKTFQGGNDMLESVAELAIDTFDSKTRELVSKLTINNCDDIINRIYDIYANLNESLTVFRIELDEECYSLKAKECWYEYDLLKQKKILKEIEQAEKEILKEQLKEEKQIERNKEKREKERMNLQYKYMNAKDEKQKEQIQQKIRELSVLIDGDEYRLTHNRCGYVYVVSNDDMSPNQYKIGITRRTVEERMKELGSGASHSFPMNVHGYVWCNDCFKVESTIHKALKHCRVNQLNPKKEWFKTTLDEIRRAFKEHCDIDIDLEDVSNEAYQFSKKELDI